MSFLNPVNEPVKRFKSTDAGAPQINYNARTAGDVKAILKACLVTGYGAISSAGWTAANEASNVIEFVSPSVAMSDYRLGIDDTSAANTTWYYQYQDARTNPANNAPKKTFTSNKKTSASNGWQLLVTERGIYFIEIIDSAEAGALVSRVTYWGATKSALVSNIGINIAFWCVGHGAPVSDPYTFFDPANTTNKHYRISDYDTLLKFAAANISTMGTNRLLSYNTLSSAELISELFIHNDGLFVAQQPAILLKDNNNPLNLYGVYDSTINSRPVLSTCLTWDTTNASQYERYARTVLIYLDYWGY